MTYPSKVDVWLVGLISVILLGNLGLMLFLWFSQPTVKLPFGVSILLLMGVIGFCVWLFSTTRYTVTDDQLLVRSGPFTWNIPVTTITQVKVTRNPISSPALSLDRLEISYGSQKKIMISPKDKTGFLQAIGQNIDSSRT